MRRRAFTLIELLVVVSIIALLISALVPSLSRARKQARAVVCASNLRSLATAVHTYANVNEDRLVTAGLAHGGSVDEQAAWMNQLEDYYGDKLVARCPDDKSVHFKTPVPGTDPPQRRRSSYGSNYYTVKEIGGTGPYDKLSMFKRPSATIFMVEIAEEGGYAASDHVHPEAWFLDPRRQAAEEMQYERHLGRANYSFMDAHVEPLKFEQTYEIGGLTPEGNLAFIHNKYDPNIAR